MTAKSRGKTQAEGLQITAEQEKRLDFPFKADDSRFLGAQAGRDGVHFGCVSRSGAAPFLILYQKGSAQPLGELAFPPSAAKDGYYSMKVKLPAGAYAYEYNFREENRIYTDPYARLVAGREEFGALPASSPHALRAGILNRKYNWEGDRSPQIPYHEAVMYHLHVRGFTKNPHSGVHRRGTFAGLKEKIPYLKSLGINQVKLMPVYEFEDQIALRPAGGSRECAQNPETAPPGERYKLNYWGYGPGYYFAPKAAYASGTNAAAEMRDLVKALHRAGIEVLLDFSFTDETDFCQIAECLSFWAQEYHIDGFDVKARDSAAAELSRLPLFHSRKLLCTWFPQQIKEINAGKGCLLAESNDGFMNDCRQLLRGDPHILRSFGERIRKAENGCAQINYMANHDGFTLLDLVSYNQKHNESNGEGNRDGTDYNFSWNCGEEGVSRKRSIAALRLRQRKNACLMMLLSQGTPMLLAGDEMGNSQQGNNNPYCQDNVLSWTDWNRTADGRRLQQFVREAIAYRRAHPVLHQPHPLRGTDFLATGFPDLSFHGSRAWYGDFDQPCCHLGCLYCGAYAGETGFLYIAYNFDRSEQTFALPLLARGMHWYRTADTSKKKSFLPLEEQQPLTEEKYILVPERTVVILEGR